MVQVPDSDSQTSEPPELNGANLPVCLTPFNVRGAKVRRSVGSLSVSISPVPNAQLKEFEVHVEWEVLGALPGCSY